MRAHKKDVNHVDVGDAMRAAGYSVLDLAQFGVSVDYAVASPGHFTALVEVKKPGPPSARKLTEKEQELRDGWQGAYIVVQSGEEAVAELQAQELAWKALAMMEGRF